MARIRTIKPEFWSDEKTGKLSAFATKLFLGMLTFSDDYGVIEFNSSQLRARIFPYNNGSLTKRIEAIIHQELSVLVRQFVYNDKKFLQITNFSKHQRIDHPGKTTVPKATLAKIRESSRGLTSPRA